jgi:hypothetical protein
MGTHTSDKNGLSFLTSTKRNLVVKGELAPLGQRGEEHGSSALRLRREHHGASTGSLSRRRHFHAEASPGLDLRRRLDVLRDGGGGERDRIRGRLDESERGRGVIWRPRHQTRHRRVSPCGRRSGRVEGIDREASDGAVKVRDIDDLLSTVGPFRFGAGWRHKGVRENELREKFVGVASEHLVEDALADAPADLLVGELAHVNARARERKREFSDLLQRGEDEDLINARGQDEFIRDFVEPRRDVHVGLPVVAS